VFISNISMKVEKTSVEIMKSTGKVLLVSLNLIWLPFFVTCAIVDTDEGRIEGVQLINRKGELYEAFRGIPFANPPLGELRFLPLEPKTPWTGVLECKSFGPMCMQEDTFGNGLNMSEDCLHLNVFTKNLPEVDGLPLVPVIAFIHGGGFESGSAIEQDPLYLMERNLVVVTINYRLGAFGFMSLNTSEVSGNQGLKDQTMALRWIQRNIKRFGGDPEKVTLAGLSAGGHAVTAHMASPMSNGLFRNVIAVSGAIAWQKKLKTDNIETVKLLAEKISCTTANVEEMLKCFRTVSVSICQQKKAHHRLS
jgi:carboxylesterase type B